MVQGFETLISLPEGFPKVSTGILLDKEKVLVTGHENGYVAVWNFGSNDPKIILRGSSNVNALLKTENDELLVGCYLGDLFRLSIPSFRLIEKIFPATVSKFDRIFRLGQTSNQSVVYTSTYGRLSILEKMGTEWRKLPDNIRGHSNAVFSLAKYEDNLFATGDYRGNILIWEINGKELVRKDRLGISSYVSGLSFLGQNMLAALGSSGTIYLFEYDTESRKWRITYQTDLASDEGTSIGKSLDEKYIFAATDKEILQVDTVTQETFSANVKSTKSIFPKDGILWVLTEDRLLSLPFSAFETKLDLVKYQYFKIGLLGDTSCGKSTLCSSITTGDTSYQGSTFGRRIWNWDFDPINERRKILLNDNAGQEQVAGTLLPLTADSDIILFLFKKTSLGTFRTALELHSQIRPLLNSQTRTYLVETFVDDDNEGVPENLIQDSLKKEGFDGLIRVSPIKIDQVKDFETNLLSKLDWKKARTAAQSVYVSGLTQTLEKLKEEGITVTNVDELRRKFEILTKKPIYKYHLMFLLRNFTDSGQLEYYPKVGDKVVLDDPEFNKLRSRIPVYVGAKGGIVEWKEIEEKFNINLSYVPMLDEFYLSNHISIPFNDKRLRVFCNQLEDRKVEVNVKIVDSIANEGTFSIRSFKSKEFVLPIFLLELNDLDLRLLDITKHEGVFSWSSKAFLYYNVEESQSLFGGDTLKFTYKIVGSDDYAVKSLTRQFEHMLGALYGEPPTTEGVK